jgi:hypothetical protein
MQKRTKFPKFHSDAKRSDRKRNRSQYLRNARRVKQHEHEFSFAKESENGTK